MPWQGDGLLHFYRLAALENAIAAGDLYPRWLPDLGYGYGFPLFNYYAPLSYYVALPFRWLGLPLKTTTNASYILAMVTLTLSAYTLGRGLWGRTAGFVSAAALLTSPYILYNLHHRAALAELWGLATLTATLAAIQAARNAPTLGRFLLITLTYATLMLSHNITALIGTPIILGFTLWPWLTNKVTSYKLQVTSTNPPTQHSAPSTQHSALSTQHSTLSTQPSAPSTQPSLLSTLYSLLSLLAALALTTFFWLPPSSKPATSKLTNSPHPATSPTPTTSSPHQTSSPSPKRPIRYVSTPNCHSRSAGHNSSFLLRIAYSVSAQKLQVTSHKLQIAPLSTQHSALSLRDHCVYKTLSYFILHTSYF